MSAEEQDWAASWRDREDERIGHAERDSAVGMLRAHVAAGRISSRDYEELAQQAMAARTWAELGAVFAHLPEPRPRPGVEWHSPVEPAAPASPEAPRPPEHRRGASLAELIMMRQIAMGWSYEDLAEAGGGHPGQGRWMRYATAGSVPPPNEVPAIARALDVSELVVAEAIDQGGIELS